MSSVLRVNPDGVSQFTQKQIAEARGCSLRTVIRDIRRYRPEPVAFIGLQPVFTIDEIQRMEATRLAHRSKQIGYTDDRDAGAALISMTVLRKVKKQNGKKRKVKR